MSDYIIVNVEFDMEYKLNIKLKNEKHIQYDLRSKLKTARFQELQDMDVFRTGWIKDGRRICWKTGAELSLDEILMYSKAYRQK